ncbi:hypothetical protein H8K38_03285 [Undibacterium sp. FT79W]|uniref:hypothetical protein n=1 Tax=Undibacterium sp. FT79W TaxID=2762296 RepID=UPI00164CD5DF|nr:hypothetical protein [Undibacterium sp. FT79W]MBC3876826.1 hypothetical protein [Undibacterium sp. FT79W]
MLNSIYDKTEKGREEIATRKHHLANRLRTLLVMVDGKQSATDLLKKVSALGFDENNVQELLDQEFITVVSKAGEMPVAAAPEINLVSDLPPPVAVAVEEMSESEQFREVYTFFNETIKSVLGLRGFTLQMKVERASTLDDFKKLRQPYLEAVLKSKGREMARSLRDRLDYLLYKGEQVQQSDTLLRDSAINFSNK